MSKLTFIFKKKLTLFSLIVSGLFFCSSHLFASGGMFWEYEKIDFSISASYTFFTPVGKFADSGRGSMGDRKLGQGFELEGMYYFEPGDDEHLRIGVGASIPFYWMPFNANYVDPQLTTAFSKEQFGSTTFQTPKHHQWFSWGLGGAGSVAWSTERFSAEFTLKMGEMFVYSPKYELVGGSYVPPEFSHYFAFEGGNGRSTKTFYVNTGLQANFMITEQFGIFAGVGFQYMNPTFKKDLTYIEMVNNEATIQRKMIKVNEPMAFFQYRFGVTFIIFDE